MSDDGLIDLIRREAAIVVAQMHQPSGIVVCTSYDPQKHTMRGILVPHGIETGDIAIGVNAIGDGYGEVTGPKVGDPQKLDGDQFVVSFGHGDGNMPVATHRIFSDADKPPVVQPGEWMRKTAQGQTVFFDKDGSVTVSLVSGTKVVLNHDTSATLQHGPSGSMIQIDEEGHHVHDTKGKKLTIKAGGGAVSIDPGVGGSVSMGNGQSPMTIASQGLNIIGPATLNGQPIATSS